MWNTRSVDGVHRFLARVYRAFEGGLVDEAPSKDQLRLLHATIRKVTTETEDLRFNTGVAAMMEFVNGVYKWNNRHAHCRAGAGAGQGQGRGVQGHGE